jgi:hypothetical protein
MAHSRRPERRLGALLALASLPLILPAAGFSEEPARYRVGPLAARIVVDGRVDEPAWQSAPVIVLAQKEPIPGGSTLYRTELRIVRTKEALVFGFRCLDPEPERILVHSWERDGDFDEDDRVAILLDTFSDGRTGYWFRLNAVGARQDGLISGPDSSTVDWDGLWRGRTARDAEGWTAEVEIPLRSVRFGQGDSWGFNALRYVARERQTQLWSGISLDSSPIDLSRAGRLEGLSGLRQGLGFTAAPYALGRLERGGEPRRSTSTSDVGLDLSYNLSPELGAALSLNTDFAETEVDARQVNLTRFPLFFPEKRPFFLEGSNQFEFGLGLAESFIPFYSRRVGLFQGERIPITAGARLLGRAGRLAIAALDVATDDRPGAPGSNLFASRVTLDAAAGLRFGLLATMGNPDGVDSNSLAGGDVVWRTPHFRGDKNLALGLWGARATGDLPAGDPSGGGLRLEYPNDRWYGFVQVDQFGAALRPALGFLPRPGTRQWNGGVAFQPRPTPGGRFGWARQFFFESFYERVERLDGAVESWRLFTAPWNVTTQGGGRLETNWAPEFQRLIEPFEVADGIVIPAGEYRFDRFRIEAFTPTTRKWRIGTSSWFGEFFSGHLTEANLEATWTPFDARLAVDFSGTTFIGRLREGDFTVRLWQLRGSWAFTPDLMLSSFLQYDSGSENFGANTRLRWTIKPGSDLFVVWTRGYLRDTEAGSWHLRPQRDEIVLKLRWTVQR